MIFYLICDNKLVKGAKSLYNLTRAVHTLSTVKCMYLDCPYMDIVGTLSVNTIKIQSHIFNVRNIIKQSISICM